MLHDLRPDITVHGFRSAFKDWSSDETSFPDHLSEAALAHPSADKVRGHTLAATCSRSGVN